VGREPFFLIYTIWGNPMEENEIIDIDPEEIKTEIVKHKSLKKFDNKYLREINKTLHNYANKFGFNYNVEVLEQYLNLRKDLQNQFDKIASDLVSRSCRYVEIKTVLYLCKSIDNILDKIMSENYQNKITEVNVILIEKLFNWIEYLDYYRQKFNINDDYDEYEESSQIDDREVIELLQKLKLNNK
jgi:hypothetical protein